MAAELRAYFGEDAVFFDETGPVPGVEWPRVVREALERSDVVLVVIGRGWLHAQDPTSGRRRLDMEADWVRQEIHGALEGVSQPLVVPVLVADTALPTAAELGEELKSLSTRQALRISDTGTRYDFQELQDFLVRQGCEPRVLPPVTTPRFGSPPKPLSADGEREFLAEFAHWDIVETPEVFAPGAVRRELHRVYEFPTFELAFQYMNEVVAQGVEPYNHHPRWENAFNRVEIWLTTFNLNYRPSTRDVRLARICESVWRDFLANRPGVPGRERRRLR